MTPALRVRLLPTLLLVGMAGSCVSEDQPRDAAGVDRDSSVRSEAAGVADPVEAAPAWASEPGGPTLFEHVTEYARLRARRPYRRPVTVVSRTVSELTYGQYRGIGFRRERAVWSGAGAFEVHLFHPGGGNDIPVRVHLVGDDGAEPLHFDPTRFTYGDELDGLDVSVPPEAGYAGLKVLFPLNHPDRMDEVVSFLGASYFRLLGPGHAYGLSTRGLAVDVARPAGEEFPDFVEFWLVEPAAADRSLTIMALLDGPSVSGAFRFELRPADDPSAPTVMDVEARLFARTDVGKLGVAPLTSMYLHGTFTRGGDDDFRPRVHDSEGLLVHSGRDEWIWRPLTNGSGIRLTSLRDESPSGFGLVQRERSFDGYMDLEAAYHRRPSEWVEVTGDWGRGGVELLEIPTDSEFNDNIVASWVPDEPFRAGEERSYRYRLITFDDRLDTEVTRFGRRGQHLAQVVRTRIGWDALPGQVDAPPRSHRRIVVDFGGVTLSEMTPDASIEAVAETSAGRITDLRVHVLPDGGRRATFAHGPFRARLVDGLAADLRSEGRGAALQLGHELVRRSGLRQLVRRHGGLRPFRQGNATSPATSRTVPTIWPRPAPTSRRRAAPGALLVYGISSGALRAALFTERHPERVKRLALDAFVWTGEGSPTLAERRKKLPLFLESTRRPIDKAFVQSIFSRDHPGTAEDKVVDAFAEAITALDDSMPNGTYIDMCSNLPIVDPEKIPVPTIIMRGQYDGIAGLGDLMAFFERLPNADKQFAIMPGISHASFQQKNYLLVYHILESFFAQPAPVYRGEA